MIHIDLAVPLYLKTYLTSVYGVAYHVTTNDDLGILILNTLKKKSIYYNHANNNEQRTNVFTIHISMSMFEKYGCNLSEEQLFQIYKNIDYGFRRHLYISAIVNKEYQGIPYKNTIENTLRAFRISEEELSYGTIRKDFNRKKGALIERLLLKGHF